MLVDLHGGGCAECGRPVVTRLGSVMRPCGCLAGGPVPPEIGGGAVVALPLPRRSTECLPVEPWEAIA